MQNLNEAFSKVGLDTLNQLNKTAELVLKSTEELFNLNLEFTKKSFDHNSQTAESMLKNCNNPQEAGKEASEWASQKGEQLTQHLQALYSWAEAVQQNTQKLAENQFAAAQTSIKNQLAELKKASPEQTHAMFDQIQQAFETTKSTIESLQTTAKEVQKNVAETVKQSQKQATDAVKNASAVAAAKVKK
ncbi:MAG: phasin family protein [Neisseriaceae bacterium]|nr:phasin family protein [Neisseriaceae bacterium]